MATCSLDGIPNAAPKFFLKIEGHYLYLVDYTMGRTWENLKANPYASLSFMDTEALIGYQVNGSAKIIESGEEYDRIFKEMMLKEVDLSAKRIVEGVLKGRKHDNFELSIRDKFAILKLRIEEIITIGTGGQKNRVSLDTHSDDKI